jgi:hypothetical protein
MTQEEFIQSMIDAGYAGDFYKIEGDKLIITYSGRTIKLRSEISPGIIFRNNGDVHLLGCETLPEGTVFENEGTVDISNVKEIPKGTIFSNGGYATFPRCSSISSGVKFINGGDVYFGPLRLICPSVKFLNSGKISILEWTLFSQMEGIDSKKILDKMISIGLFQRN